jgi:anthranilate synthase component 1
MSRSLRLLRPPETRGQSLPKCFLGGWVGFAGYDTVRYAEPDKLDPAKAPPDDRALPDLDLAYYDGVVVFDHVDKLVHVIRLLEATPGASEADLSAAYDHAAAALERRVRELQTHSKPLASGRMDPGVAVPPGKPSLRSNLTRAQHAAMVGKALEYIRAGDIFQVVLGQRFERTSPADPFDVYRALRAVNPSPYMVYMQATDCILVASSPEILCRVRATGASEQEKKRIVTNRPLAGTRRRGATPEEDRALEKDLLADPKEIAEHSMLVDLGRNDVGRVAVPGTISIPARMVIERYSHVMHISSTVTGELRPELDCWDALRAALPVGTISGAPKIRAMQIIDELEPIRRGPYGGGIGYVGLDGDMDIALALRTMVVPTAMRTPAGEWTYHIQAAGGIVADSQPEPEYMETVNKAAALARAIEVAEQAFGQPPA